MILGNTSTCSCISAGHFPLKVPTGATHQLTVKVMFGLKAGDFEHHITYYTDSEYLPAFAVAVRGRVVVDEKIKSAQ